MSNSRELDYLDRCAEFADYLASSDHELLSKLIHLSRVVFKPLKVNQVAFVQLIENDNMQVVARFGMSDAELATQNNIVNLSMGYPVSVSVRENRIVWINSLPDWGSEFSILKNFKVNLEDKLYFCLPVLQNEIPSSVLTFRCDINMELDSDTEAFLLVISSIFSLYHYRKITVSPDEPHLHLDLENENLTLVDHELTERQRVILRLISEERTNKSISELLGYSESTIRQEIMRIYYKLGCSHRSEAATIYKNMELIES